MAEDRRRRVVVVDDDEHMQRLIEANLNRAGFEVIAAGTGPAGLDLIQGLRPDVVILDVLLPGMDGFTVCQRLKETPGVRDIPVILLSAVYVTPEDVDRGLRIGAEEYLLKADVTLSKPIQMPRLVATVQRLVGQEAVLPPDAEVLLLVEDDPAQADYARTLLRREAYRCDYANTGEAALEQLDPDRHILVLCDFRLPGLTGLDVLREMRRRDLDAAFVLITAEGSEEVAAEAIAAGADDYVIKPLRADSFGHLLQRNISRARLRAERRALVAHLRHSNIELMRRYTESERRRGESERLLGELRRTQEELVRAQRLGAITETAVAVNHEINNPLAAISGLIYLLLQEGQVTDERALRRLHAIDRQCARIRETTLKLSRVSRPVSRRYAEGVAMLDLDASTENDER